MQERTTEQRLDTIEAKLNTIQGEIDRLVRAILGAVEGELDQRSTAGAQLGRIDERLDKMAAAVFALNTPDERLEGVEAAVARIEGHLTRIADSAAADLDTHRSAPRDERLERIENGVADIARLMRRETKILQETITGLRADDELDAKRAAEQ